MLPSASSRIAWVDRLKVAVIAAVITFHAATSYVVPIDWHYEERTGPEEVGLALLLGLSPLALFGLGPLFLLGGLLAAGSLARRGTGSFVRSRLLRLGVPAVVFLAVVDPLADFGGHSAEGGPRPLRHFLTDLVGDRDIGVFWFVVALLAFSLGYAAWRHRRPPAAREGGPVPLAAVVVTGAATAVGSAVVWVWWDPLAPTFWSLRWGQWPLSAALFGLGVAMAERGWRTDDPLARRCGRAALLGLAVLVPVVGLGITEGPSEAPVLRGWAVGALVPLVAVVSPTSTVWFVHLVRRRWEHLPTGRPLALAARGAYAAYLLHPLVLVALGVALRPLPVPVLLKLPVVAALGIVLAFTAGAVATRLPGLRRVL